MGQDLLLKVLFVIPYAPDQIRTRSLNLIKALAALGHRITLATLWSSSAEQKSLKQLEGFLEGLIAERIGSIHSRWNCLKALAGPQPMQAHFSWCPRLVTRISRIMATNDFDIVHVEHLRGAKYALHVNSAATGPGGSRPTIIWDSVDCISDLFRHASQYSSNRRMRWAARIELPRTERFEGWLTTQFARILVTSESDRRGLLRLAEASLRKNGTDGRSALEKRIQIVPNGVDLAYFNSPEGPRDPQTLVITGKMSYHANINAVVRFVEGVMPKIWSRLPKTLLWIVGKDPSPEIRKLGISDAAAQSPGMSNNGSRESRIRITGTVADVRPYLHRATVSVAPIQYGAGIQNKVLEAMACGTAVVATPEAVRALHVRSDHHLVVANGEQNLADSICSLLTNPGRCSSLGLAGRAFVEANHDWRLVAQGLSRIYQNARS